MSAGAWMALAAWLAVLVGVAALVYASRQYRRTRGEAAELTQPQVAMFMEPSASDWHLIELVVKNFGRTPAYGIRFEFANPPTVGKYENSYEDQYVDIMPLNLPAEIPYLAPTQEWRIVWDSALDRRELGEAIASRFHGEVTFYDHPNGERKGQGQEPVPVLRRAGLGDAAPGRANGTADRARPGPAGEAETRAAAQPVDLLPLRGERKPRRGAAHRDQPHASGCRRATRALPPSTTRPPTTTTGPRPTTSPSKRPRRR